MTEPAATDPEGLSGTEAALRLALDGPNELSPVHRRTRLDLVREALREPMLQLLIAAVAIYWVLGNVGEAGLLLAFVAVKLLITVVQAHRTERVLDALRDLTSPRALVLRDGVAQRIAGRDVVVGDLLVLVEGDRVAADARLLSAHDLEADESLLTGEALPVRKHAAEPAAADIAPRAGGDDLPWVWAGTLLTGGQGLARVTATGARSEIGRIGRALGEIEPPPTPLQLQTRRLVRLFSALGLAISAVAVVGHGLARGDWLGGLLAGITLAMAMLPQEFQLILVVFMAMGAWRLSSLRVLARRAGAIEALGAATVLCTDKTGTLTRNRMAVAELVAFAPGGLQRWAGEAAPLSPAQQALLEAAMLASERRAFDPMERALHELAEAQLDAAARHADATLVHEYPLAPGLRAMTHGWQCPGEATQRVATKGAPEDVAALCRLSEAGLAAVKHEAQAMAARGLRVLGVASARHTGAWPEAPDGLGFAWLGLVAFADPLRAGVPEAIAECRAAGLRVVMITGDHPATAAAVAAQAGLDAPGTVVGGADLDALDDAALGARLATTRVFARIRPEQKLRLVEALKAQGEVVVMTGDGVNDAPSLKAAHIGIAMGGRGTDVAREAAALVLLDDDFGSIVRAVRLGRRIDDNLRKAMAFVLAVHVPIAGLALLPLLWGGPMVFMPVHIAFLELLIDPVCSIVFEAEGDEPDLMRRPPRDPAAPLFSPALIAWSLLEGGLVLAAVAAFFVALQFAQVGDAAARAATFTALVACNVALIVANRSAGGSVRDAFARGNPALVRMLLATGALLAGALFVAPLRTLFAFDAVAPAWLGAALGLGVAVLAALFALRRGVRGRRSRRAG